MKHECIYLMEKTGGALNCWQEGEKIKRGECTRCLLAYVVSGLFDNPLKRNATSPTETETGG